MLKICDLGTAIDKSDAATAHMDITPYLVSRFYRAPEIILGIPYDYSVDMWSIGCTLYELYTGKILFTGDSNNQMLKAIMEIRGRFTPKLFKRGQLSGVHFDDKGQFISVERDKVLGKVCYDFHSLPCMHACCCFCHSYPPLPPFPSATRPCLKRPCLLHAMSLFYFCIHAWGPFAMGLCGRKRLAPLQSEAPSPCGEASP